MPYTREMIVRKPDIEFLRRFIEIDGQGILQQTGRTRDGRLTIVPQCEGFLGGGIHRFVFYIVAVDGRNVLRTANYTFALAYLEHFLRKNPQSQIPAQEKPAKKTRKRKAIA